MNTETTPPMNSRLRAVLTLAKIRGYKEVSERQMAVIHELLPIQELTPTNIVNEVLDAPAERVSRTVTAGRKHLSNALSCLSKALNPK
jgi:hypothetical protein